MLYNYSFIGNIKKFKVVECLNDLESYMVWFYR